MPFSDQQPTQRRKRGYRLILGVVASLVVVLSLIELFLTNHLASQGERSASISAQVQLLRLSNQALENKKMHLSSLARIASDSSRLGLSKATHFLYITPQTFVAYQAQP